MIQSQEKQKSDALDIQDAFDDIDADPDEDNVDVLGRCRKLLQLLVALWLRCTITTTSANLMQTIDKIIRSPGAVANTTVKKEDDGGDDNDVKNEEDSDDGLGLW